MFIVTFVIMLPITLATKDPIKGWEAGLVWVFFQSFILMIGGFIAPNIRMITPRAALLGTLAGAVLTYFGFMHGDAVGVGHGLGVTPSVALSYLIVAGFLFMLARAPVIIDAPAKQAAVPAE
jgi:hypothetical protein